MSRRRAPEASASAFRRSRVRAAAASRLRAAPAARARLRGVEILLPRLHRRQHLVFVGVDVASSPPPLSGGGSRRTRARLRLGVLRRRFRGGGGAANPGRSAPAASRRRRRLRAAAWVLAPGDWRASSRARRLRYPARRRPEPRARRTGAARTRFVSSPRPGARNRRRRRRASRACRRRTRRRDARTRSPVSPGPRASSRRAGEAPRRRRRRRAPSRPGTARGARDPRRRRARFREGSRVGHRGLRRRLRRAHGLHARGRLHGCCVHHVLVVVAAVRGDGEARRHGDAGGRRGGLAREIPAWGRDTSPSLDERSTAGLRCARIGFRQPRACVPRVLLIELRLERAIQPVHLLHPGRSSRVVLVRLSPMRPEEIRLPHLEVATRRGHPRDEIDIARSHLAQPRARARNLDIPAARLHRGRLSPRLTL